MFINTASSLSSEVAIYQPNPIVVEQTANYMTFGQIYLGKSLNFLRKLMNFVLFLQIDQKL